MALLTIVIPVYNVEKYLARCLDSVCRQGFVIGELEVLLIDDGSNDRSNGIAREYAQKYPFIRVIRKENGGLSSARNCGIDHAQGKYVMFLDSDDYIAENVLSGLIKRMERENLDFLGYGVKIVRSGVITDYFRGQKRPDEDRVLTGTDFLCRYDIIISACMHIALKDKYNNLRFTEGVLHEDYAFMLRLYERTKRMGFTDTAVYFYDIKESGTISTTRTTAQRLRSNKSWILELDMLRKWLQTIEDSEFCRQAQRAYNGYCYVALTSLLVSKMPWSEKLGFYKAYSELKAFNIGRTNLSVKRKMRKMIYAIKPLYKAALKMRCTDK